MSLPSFDEMKAMSSDELDALFDTEAEKVIESAPEHMKDRLNAIAGGCRMRRQATKSDPVKGLVLAQQRMWASFGKLNDELEPFRD